MTDLKKVAQQVMNEYYAKLGPGPYYYDNSAVSSALREVINQLQQSSATHPAFISCPDLLELCEELENLYL